MEFTQLNPLGFFSPGVGQLQLLAHGQAGHHTAPHAQKILAIGVNSKSAKAGDF
jgi:hypothetical protein